MKISRNFLVLSAILFLTFITSCVETVVVGSVGAAALVSREKTLNNTRYDVQIFTTLQSDFVQNGLKNFGNSINATVNEGRVLLTGIARDSQKAKLAVKLAWNASNVKEVIDEIQLRPDEKMHFRSFSSAAYDYFITSKIETKLLFTRKVSTFNYKVTTVDGHVYLIGVARDNAELAKVIAVITKISGVEKIISHVILENDSRRNG
ncbi:MAG: BON domain-containing protein [Rickettsiales bacterium]|nr:BON domain-containing protein [Rickettsiales bacterium]